MLEFIFSAISYICQIAIILYVLKEFGYIATKKESNGNQNSNDSDQKSQSSNDNPFGQLMSSLQPMLQDMTKKMQPAQAVQTMNNDESGNDDKLLEQEMS